MQADILVVGAPGESDPNTADGAVYIFERHKVRFPLLTAYVRSGKSDYNPLLQTTKNSFSEAKRLLCGDGGNSKCGHSVSIDATGSTVVAGAPTTGSGVGKTFVFERDSDGTA